MRADDEIIIYYDVTKAPKVAAAIQNDQENIGKILKKPFFPMVEKKAEAKIVKDSLVTFNVDEEQITIEIVYVWKIQIRHLKQQYFLFNIWRNT